MIKKKVNFKLKILIFLLIILLGQKEFTVFLVLMSALSVGNSPSLDIYVKATLYKVISKSLSHDRHSLRILIIRLCDYPLMSFVVVCILFSVEKKVSIMVAYRGNKTFFYLNHPVLIHCFK